MNRETAIKNQILIGLGSRPDVLIWNSPCGKFFTRQEIKRWLKDEYRIDASERVLSKLRPVAIGYPGQADTMAIVEVEITPDMVGQRIGVFAGLEVKTPKTETSRAGTQSEQQEKWQRAVQKRGGHYALVRSPAEADAVIAKIQNKAGK